MKWACFFYSLLQTVQTVRYDAVKQRTGYFWQIDGASLSLGRNTSAGNRGNSGPEILLRESNKEQPLYKDQGTPGDSSTRLVRSAAQFMKSVRGEEVDFILWTGDSGPRVRDQSMTEREVARYIKEMTLLLREEFPYSSIYPVLGDRDFHPASHTSPAVLKFVGKLWEVWLPPTAVKTLRKGGYYQVELAGRRLQLIGLNTALWSQENKALTSDLQGDPGGQFQWLESVLRKVRQKKQTVILFGHTPPGVAEQQERGNHRYWYHHTYNTRYKSLVVEFSDVIVGQFFGHQNTDTFRIFYDANNSPVSWALVSPGLAAPSGEEESPGRAPPPPPPAPSIRLYRYNTYDGKILDYSQFILPPSSPSSSSSPGEWRLEQYTEYTDHLPQPRYNWKLQYNFSSVYRLPGISPQYLHQLLHSFQSEDRSEYFETYLWYNTNQPLQSCAKTCRSSHLCSIPNIEYSNFHRCVLSSNSSCSRLKHSNTNSALVFLSVWIVTLTTLIKKRLYV